MVHNYAMSYGNRSSDDQRAWPITRSWGERILENAYALSLSVAIVIGFAALMWVALS